MPAGSHGAFRSSSPAEAGGAGGVAARAGSAHAGAAHAGASMAAFLAADHNGPKTLVWTATAEDFLAKVRRGRVALERISA